MKLTRNEYDVIRSAAQMAFDMKITVECNGWTDFYEQPAEWGVNWSAIGTASPEETRKFAQNMVNASVVAEELTRWEITLDRSIEDTVVYDAETYHENVEKIAKGFKGGSVLRLNCFMSKIVEKRGE